MDTNAAHQEHGHHHHHHNHSQHQRKIKKKFNTLVADVPKPLEYDVYIKDKDGFEKYHIDVTYHHGDEEEKKRTVEPAQQPFFSSYSHV